VCSRSERRFIARRVQNMPVLTPGARKADNKGEETATVAAGVQC